MAGGGGGIGGGSIPDLGGDPAFDSELDAELGLDDVGDDGAGGAGALPTGDDLGIDLTDTAAIQGG
jgi:hypothetical protein